MYEGDPTRLAAAIERYDVKSACVGELGENKAEDGEDDDDVSDISEDDSVADSNDDDDGRKEEERVSRQCPPVRLRMIDFAHTWLAQGEGPDEGVLLGIKTLRGLIRDRKALMGMGE